MENSRFDMLVKVLAARRPRRAVPPLLAALGLGLADRDDAGAKNTKNNDQKEIRICTCGSADVATCTTQKKEKSKARKTLRRNPCAYKGRCQGRSGCVATSPLSPPVSPPVSPPPPPPPGFSCTSNAQCARFEACFGTRCGPCTRTADCEAGEACLAGRCIAGSGRNSIACSAQNATGDAECQAFSPFLGCFETEPTTTPVTIVCALGNNCPPTEPPDPTQCTQPGRFCLLGECVMPCSSTVPCPGSETCLVDICVP